MSSYWLTRRRGRVASELADHELLVLFASVSEDGTQLPASDFGYLSDFWEGNAIFVLSADGHTAMYTDVFETDKAKWYDPPAISRERLGKRLMLDKLGNLDDAKRELVAVLADYTDIYTNFAVCTPHAPHPWLQSLLSDISRNIKLHDSHDLLAKFRVVKDQEELARIRRAVGLARDALDYVEMLAPRRDYEYQIAADFSYWLRGHNSVEAFPTIVAQGSSGGVMHHRTSNHYLTDGEAVLIDAGSRRYGYCSDITRTIPYRKTFTRQQQEVYYWVKRAKEAVIAAIKPGVDWKYLQDTADRCLAEGLIELGVLSQPLEAVLEQKLFKEYTIHSIGHWLGIDVHDSGDYERALLPGMVLTVEPGLYLNSCRAFAGVNVRLEDDVLVTVNGSDIL